MKIVSLIGRISSTSIPIDIMCAVQNSYPVEVTIAAFYESDTKTINSSNIEDSINIIPLGAKNRFDIFAFNRLSKIIPNADILHTHDNFIGSIARIIAATKGTPVVNTEHGSHERFTLLQNMINSITLPLSNVVVSNSESTESSFQWYEEILLSNTSKKIIYNGVDLQKLDSALPTVNSSSSNNVKIISVGRLIGLKNYATLLRSFAIVCENHPNTNLIIVGDGPEREKLEQMAFGLRITENVEFRGQLQRKEVYQLLHESDLFALPSTSEGFCVAAVEAMACGLPVVVSDIDVFHEVLNNTGIFVNPDDYTELASKLCSLVESESLRKKYGRSAKQYARQTYSLSKTAGEYYELYQSVSNRIDVTERH